MKKIFTPNFITITAMIAFVAIARFFTPIPNFTPVAAIALFGGAYFTRKSLAFLIPLIALTISNLWIGMFDALTMSAVYFSFILTVGIGMLISRKVSFMNVTLGAILSSILFFAITNFAVWMSGFCFYPMTLSGLVLCYEMAIPFFRNELLGTLVYSGVLFGAFELAKRRFPVLVR